MPIDTGDPAPASHKLAKLCREHADAGDLKFADGHDAHRRSVRVHVDVKRRERLP